MPQFVEPGDQIVSLVGGVDAWSLPLVGAPAVRHCCPPGGVDSAGFHFFEDSDGACGYRRIHADLADDSTECSPELVHQIMPEEGLIACQPRPFRITVEADAEAAAAMPGLHVFGDGDRLLLEESRRLVAG